jgi:hypothetical protein
LVATGSGGHDNVCCVVELGRVDEWSWVFSTVRIHFLSRLSRIIIFFVFFFFFRLVIRFLFFLIRF